MAEKYIRHGATFNGDGTSSALAASDGGVGAWNDVWSLLLGSIPAFGTLVAGDNVNIRALDESSIALSSTITVNTTYGNANGTAVSPISWIVDDGTIWTGVTGGLTIDSVTNINLTFLQYNNFSGATGTRNLVVSLVSLSNKGVTIQAGELANAKLTFPSSGQYGVKLILGTAIRTISTYRNVLIEAEKWYLALITTPSYAISKMLDVEINILVTGEADPLILTGSFGSTVLWKGGRVYGNGLPINSKLVNPNLSGGSVELIDVEVPQSLAICDLVSYVGGSKITSIGSDSNLGNFVSTKDYEYDSRNDGNYPTLNAKLPTSTLTPWSYRVYPFKTQAIGYTDIPISLLWTQAASTLTATLNFLCDTTLPVPTTNNVWIDYSYIDDATGNRVAGTTKVTAQGATNISTSTANWSATTYGANNYNKHKLSFTLPSNIKQDSILSCLVQVSIFSPSRTQVLFIDPELVIS